MDVPQARRVARPSWINARTALGVILFGVALLTGTRVLQGARATVPMWTAARDIPANSPLQEADLGRAEVRIPPELMSRYVSAEADVTGSVLTRAVRAGELIPAEWISEEAAALAGRSMTIPITPEHALGAGLRPGDHIDVLATFDAGDVRARTVVVARGVEVLNTVSAGGLVVDEQSVIGISVAVSPEEASSIAFAIRTAEVDIIRVDGKETEEAPTVRASDF